MTMAARIEAAMGHPEELESLYRAAVETGEAEAFAGEILRRHAESPHDLLIGAWYHRLRPRLVAPAAGAATAASPRRAQWRLALVLSLALATSYVAIGSGRRFMADLMFAWAPAAAAALLIYLRVGPSGALGGAGFPGWSVLRGRPLIATLALAGITLIAIRRSGDLGRPSDLDALTLIHLPAVAWLVLGWAVLGSRAAPRETFAAVRKSIEALITAGLFAAAGAALTLMTAELFRAIGVELPKWILRCFGFGGPGMIPVLAVATVYDPDRSPSEQRGEHGIARVIFTTGRLFLPLTLAVLVVYLIAIPFRFMEPFRSREVLITYNAMLFAVIALTVAATPLRETEVPGRLGPWVRRGVLAVAACALLVSLYAMAAVLHRTATGGLTVNRLTVIGWNTVNIATLAVLLARSTGARGGSWIEAAHRTFGDGLKGYAAWTLTVLIVLPLLPLGGR